MKDYNYVAVFDLERMFNPDDSEDIGFTKHFVSEAPSDMYENGDYSEQLKEYAVKYLVRKRDFTKKTDCVCVWARYYNPEDFGKPLRDPVVECHTYIYKEDLTSG